MTDTWKLGVSGDWNIGSLWTTGVPTASDDAVIEAAGSYTVTISSAAAANSLTFWNTATLSETAGGSMTMAAFDLEGGTAILRGTNNFANITLGDATLEVTRAAALSTGLLTLESTGALFFVPASMTLANSEEWDDGTIAAASGKTLTLAADNLTVNDARMTFGTAGDNGTIVLTSNTDAFGGTSATMTVAAGTLRAGDATLGDVLQHSDATAIGAGATLDLGGFAANISDLQGTGVLANSGARTSVGINGGSFGGVISGKFDLTVTQNVTLLGTNTFKGDTEVTNGFLALGNGGTTGSIKGGIVIDDVGQLFVDRSNTIALANAISGAGLVRYEGSGTAIVNHANTYSGGTDLDSGALALGNANGLGTGVLSMQGGTLLATATETVTNSFDVNHLFANQASTFAAAHGKTLTLAPGDWHIAASTFTLDFGDGTNDGTVVWTTPGTSTVDSGSSGIDVRSGTLKDGDGSLSTIATSVTVDAGATIDYGAFNSGGIFLNGAGTVKGDAHLKVVAGNFSGTLEGSAHLELGNSVFAGTSTCTGGNTVDSGAVFALGNGGTAGSLMGRIDNAGSMLIDRSDTFPLTNKISGAGDLEFVGLGTAVIDRANSYTGGTTIGAGVVSIDRGSALGTGIVTVNGGELLANSNATLPGVLTVVGDATFAAAHDVTFELNKTLGDPLAASRAAKYTFGDGSNDGTVVWDVPAGSTANAASYDVDVHSGTLKGGSGDFNFFFSSAVNTVVDAGAKLDLGGHTVHVANLHGVGTITGSGSGELDLVNASFAGHISGPITVTVAGTVVLSGTGSFDEADVNGGTLELSGSASEDVSLTGSSTLRLDAPNAFTGHVKDFSTGDNIILPGIASGGGTSRTYDKHTHTLTVTDGTHTAEMVFDGSYVEGNFVLGVDASGHTDVTFVAVPAHHAADWPLAG